MSHFCLCSRGDISPKGLLAASAIRQKLMSYHPFPFTCILSCSSRASWPMSLHAPFANSFCVLCRSCSRCHTRCPHSSFCQAEQCSWHRRKGRHSGIMAWSTCIWCIQRYMSWQISRNHIWFDQVLSLRSELVMQQCRRQQQRSLGCCLAWPSLTCSMVGFCSVMRYPPGLEDRTAKIEVFNEPRHTVDVLVSCAVVHAFAWIRCWKRWQARMLAWHAPVSNC